MSYRELNTPEEVETIMSPDGGAAIIDFWAPWCQPCLAMGPHFEYVAREYREEPVSFYKINTQAHPELSRPFHVRSIPTMIFVLNGEIVDVTIGKMNAQRIAAKVETLLSKARGESFFQRLFKKKKKLGQPQP